MNIAGALAALTAPPTPQQAQSQTAAMKEADQKKAREGDEAFERMIRAELEKKKAIADATPLPSSLMPWLPNQVDPNLAGDDDKQSIEAAGA